MAGDEPDQAAMRRILTDMDMEIMKSPFLAEDIWEEVEEARARRVREYRGEIFHVDNERGQVTVRFDAQDELSVPSYATFGRDLLPASAKLQIGQHIDVRFVLGK